MYTKHSHYTPLVTWLGYKQHNPWPWILHILIANNTLGLSITFKHQFVIFPVKRNSLLCYTELRKICNSMRALRITRFTMKSAIVRMQDRHKERDYSITLSSLFSTSVPKEGGGEVRIPQKVFSKPHWQRTPEFIPQGSVEVSVFWLSNWGGEMCDFSKATRFFIINKLQCRDLYDE